MSARWTMKIRREIAGFDGKSFDVENPIAASALWQKMRDTSGLGASKIGYGAKLFFNGKLWGGVSYNGRVWVGKPLQEKLYAEADGTIAASEEQK